MSDDDVRLWDLFMAEESPQARNLWNELQRITDECGIDFFTLADRMGDLPVTVYPRAADLWEQLHALGSLDRVNAWVGLREEIDTIDAHGDTLIIAAPTEESQ